MRYSGRREHGAELVGWEGPREEVALAVLATQGAQLFELLSGLDALGHHAQTEAPGHRDDGDDYALVFWVAAETRDERAIYLEEVDREALEVGE